MTERYYLQDGSHALIAGSTGAKEEMGGKTSTMNWWVRNSVANGHNDVGVFFDAKGDQEALYRTVDEADGPTTSPVRVSSLKGLAESYRSGNRLFDYDPQIGLGADDADDRLADEHRRVMQFLDELGDEAIVGHDEAHRYAHGRGFDWALNEAGNLDKGSITSLAASQLPWSLSEQQRGNLPVKIWVGPLTSEGERFFNTENMAEAKERIKDSMDSYEWAVTDGGEFQHINPPVPEVYA